MIFFRGPIISKIEIYFTFEFVDWSPAQTIQFIIAEIVHKFEPGY